MTEPTLVPAALADKVAELTANKDVLDQDIRWRPEGWDAADLGSLAQHLDLIADASDRSHGSELLIRRRHVAALEDPAPRFLAAVIWGFGIVGYGPSRVAKIAADAGPRLDPALEAIDAAARTGEAEAWDAFTGSHKLRGLGPAFATKVAYFASLAVDDSATTAPLIADLNTSWAVWDLVGLPRSVERRASYLRYVELARQWASDLECRPDDVEWALFELGKDVPRKR